MAAMYQHPVIAIQTAVQNFSLRTKPISLKLRPGEYDKIKERIGQEVAKFTSFTDATIKEFDLQADAQIKKFQNDGKREILMSALAPDFLEKYQSDLHFEDTYDKLKLFVSEIIGSQSAAAKRKAAQDQMKCIARDVSSEEKFSRFHTRLDRLAKMVTDEPAVQKFLIEEHFRNSLSPSLKTFLHERGKSSEEPAKIAEFLDKMEKFKRTVDLNSLEASETKKEILALNEKFDKLINEKFDRLQNELHEFLKFQKSKDFDFQAIEVNALTKSKSFRKTPENRQSSTNQESFPPYWELNQFGRPIRCRKCGVRGHRDTNCKGTTLTCRLCNKVGHIQPVCPKNPNRLSSKN